MCRIRGTHKEQWSTTYLLLIYYLRFIFMPGDDTVLSSACCTLSSLPDFVVDIRQVGLYVLQFEQRDHSFVILLMSSVLILKWYVCSWEVDFVCLCYSYCHIFSPELVDRIGFLLFCVSLDVIWSCCQAVDVVSHQKKKQQQQQ